MYKLSVYGKGGVGKSTVSANLSYLLSKKGKQVLHIGCDPKHDSTRLLTNGKSQKTFLDCMSEKEGDPIVAGSNDIYCLECGGAEPGIGCAGKGMSAMFSYMEDNTPEGTDVRVCDVLGDVVCGGFGVPMRRSNVDGIIIVVSEDFMSLYAANNILRGIRNLNGTACILGLVLNSRYPENRRRVDIFSEATGVPVIGTLTQSRAFADAEARGRTVSELFPDSDSVKELEVIADIVLRAVDGKFEPVVSRPLNDDAMTDIAAIRDITDRSEPTRRRRCDFDTVDEARGLVYKSNQVMPACTSHGAVHFLHTIQDAAIVLHGPRNCAWLMSYAWERDITHSMKFQRERKADNIYSTDMNMNAVFGGDRDAITKTVTRAYEDGFRVVFVVLTCTAETIGTDIIGECERIALPGLKVIPVMPDKRSLTSKFGGRSGAMAAAASLMDLNLKKEKGTVCLGFMERLADDPRNKEMIDGILGAFGLRLKYIFPGSITTSGIRDVPSCEYFLIPARGFHSKEMERYFLSGMKVLRAEPLIGMSGMRDWCRMLSEATGLDGSGYLKKIESDYEEMILPYKERLSGKKAVIYNRSGMTPNGIIDTLYDLGMEIPAYISWPDNFEDRNEKDDRHPEIRRVKDIRLCDLKEMVDEMGIDIVISGDPRTGRLGIPWTGFMAEHMGHLFSVSLAHRISNAMKIKPMQAWRE